MKVELEAYELRRVKDNTVIYRCTLPKGISFNFMPSPQNPPQGKFQWYRRLNGKQRFFRVGDPFYFTKKVK